MKANYDPDDIFTEEDALARRDPEGYRRNVDGERTIKVKIGKTNTYKLVIVHGRTVGWVTEQVI